jgi:hypothetical protein
MSKRMEAGHPGAARPQSGHANHNQIGDRQTRNRRKSGFAMTYTDAYLAMLLLISCEVEQYVPKVLQSNLYFPAMRSVRIPC